MQYGSLINHVCANSTTEFTNEMGKHWHIGMGCTELCWSDRHPFRIVEINVKGGKITSIVVQAMKVEADKSKPAQMGHQNWVISENPNGAKETLKWRRGKRHSGWYAKFPSGWGNKFLIGVAEEYYDWSF